MVQAPRLSPFLTTSPLLFITALCDFSNDLYTVVISSEQK